MTNPEVAEALNRLFARRGQFIVLGLTGRTGSGCSTAAELLSKEFRELRIPEVKLTDASAEDRKFRMVRDYAEKNWHPFFTVSISNVILSFLLDKDEDEIRKFFEKENLLSQSNQLESFLTSWKPAKRAWMDTREALLDPNSSIENFKQLLAAWLGPIQEFIKTIRNGLGSAPSTKILQLIGDNLRKSGDPFSADHKPQHFYDLPHRVGQLINAIGVIQKNKGRPAYIVLDALRNPFEILYFRERFPAFYVVAISTPNDDRERRLSIRKNFNTRQITDLDEKEYPERSKPLSGYDAFTSQNIQSCLEKADIYLSNLGFVPQTQEVDTTQLTRQLIKYFGLMLHPGLVTPTRSERCMQIAFAARANSGCISRQVGAAITDENDSVKAVGWNDVPAGQVPCLLRRATDLMNSQDQAAFSDYENKDTKFRDRVKSSYKRYALVDVGGRSSAFCFKSEYNGLMKQDNQVHTRSLHAEENAFSSNCEARWARNLRGKTLHNSKPL